MFCEKCGTKNESSNKFCEKCGAELANNTAKKSPEKSLNTKDLKEKFNALTKQQKIIGGIVSVVIIALIVLYIIGSKATSLETIGKNAFEQLAKDGVVSDKYLSVKADSDEYFVSLADNMKKIIKDKKYEFDYTDYVVNAGKKSVVVKYKDNTTDKTYKVTFNVKKDGSAYLFFDNYKITKITIAKKNSYSRTILYDPSNTTTVTISAPKKATITFEGKKVTNKNLNKKKSNKEKDVYVLKGLINSSSYKVEYSIGGIKFKKNFYVYGKKPQIDLFDYISSSYVEDKDSFKDVEKDFGKYIKKYYKLASEDKSVKDLKKDYDVTEDIEDDFDTTKKALENISDFEITDVAYRSLSSNSDGITVSYKINYKYVYGDSETSRESYSYVSVKYNFNDLKSPVDLSYLPY